MGRASDQAAGARRRTLCLVAAEIAVLIAFVASDPSHGPIGQPKVSVPVLAGLFTLSGLLVFHLEFRHEAHSFSFAEVPLVLGLFLASPADLLVARLLGEAAALLFHPRQPPLKILLNLSNFVSECVVALVIFHSVFGTPAATRPLGWAAAFVAVLVADLVSVLTVGAVIRWHGGAPDTSRVAVAAIASACANGSLGVIAVLLVGVHVAASAVLGVVAVILFAAYRGYAALAERYASLQVLHEFTEAIGSALRPADVIEAMLHHARKLLRADMAELILLDSGMRMRLAGDEGVEPGNVTRAEHAALAALPADVTLLPRGRRAPGSLAPYAEASGCEDMLLVPLKVTDVPCALVVGSRLAEVSTFDKEDGRLFATLANHAAMALGKGQLIEKLQVEARRREHQALHDDLTGLPNRVLFHEKCTKALEAGHGLPAVLLMDIDQFKEVNDTLGHQTGDELLVEVGRRIEAALRPDDVAARLGGDEFAILLVPVASPEDALANARRLLDAVHAPIEVRGIELEVRGSIGAAIAGAHGDDPQTLLQHADIAMYAAKRGQSGACLYAPEIDHHSPRRLQVAAELRHALETEALVAHFQPKADLRSGRIVGVEALVRWHHADLGPIAPDEFIPIAEQTGLITPLTLIVLRQALSACIRWRRAGHDLGVAVNVSPRSLAEPGFVGDVAGLLHRAQVLPGALTLELTESAVMSDTRRALDVLEQLRDLGVRLSIDDFGTGYSSLSYLQRLPVHELKVDRSFVHRVHDDVGSRSIVRSVVDLGHNLGLVVVAEGVENQLAWDYLAETGCDVGQGYFLSRPIPVEELTAWLGRSAARPAPARSRR